jgi:hypothetical protein
MYQSGNIYLIIKGHLTSIDKPDITFDIVNRFTTNKNLCNDNDFQCNKDQYPCPIDCSEHGTCSTPFSPICNCFENYYGNDCSLGIFPTSIISKNNNFNGKIFGRNAHIYQFNFLTFDTSLNFELILSSNDSNSLFLFIKIDLTERTNPRELRDTILSQMQINKFGQIPNKILGNNNT